MNIDITIDAHGTLFIPGAPQAIMLLYVHEITQRLGDTGVNMIKAYLPTQYMYLGHNGGDPIHNPVPPGAGTYEAGIHTDRASMSQLFIHDTPVVYGPWIEGVGSKNPVIWPGRLRRGLPGRFPGYGAFRKISQALDIMAEDVAQEELGRYVVELNV